MPPSSLQIALFQPDIAQNTGAIMRLCAVWNLALHIIEPMGFTLNDPRFRRTVMDYIQSVNMTRHVNFSEFTTYVHQYNKRLVLLSTHAHTVYTQFDFSDDDILLFGRETAGVTSEVYDNCSCHLRIPMHPDARSLNVAMSCAIVSSEALRQSGYFNEMSV